MKLFVALGPGDIVAAHRAHMKGEPHQSETSIIFSGQVFEYCRERNIEMLAISYNARTDNMRDQHLQIENRPRIFEKSRGVLYHVSRIAYAAYLAVRARRFGTDLAVIDSGTAHYFALGAFRLLGIPVAVNFHNTLWPNGFEPKRGLARLILWLDGLFFRHLLAATTGVSPECGNQVRQVVGRALPFFEYRTQYRGREFQPSDCGSDRMAFRVIFVGRAERSKGVIDIAAIAERLRERSPLPIRFDVCGQGRALPELRECVERKGLVDTVQVHGRVPRAELFQLLASADAAIVPTRRDFCEGLPAVCAEAVLFSLPVVTSRLSNAIPVLGGAVAEAEPENIESYATAVLKLAEDHATYDRMRSACPQLAKQFLDRSQSYPAALDRLIASLFADWKPLRDYESIFARLG
jgi:glycosyltransferase involved in cell wall biosynthesis